MPDKIVCTVNFQPIGRWGTVVRENSPLNVARRAGIGIDSLCGGIGICNNCKIRMINGALSMITALEIYIFTTHELYSVYRLACQSFPKGN